MINLKESICNNTRKENLGKCLPPVVATAAYNAT